MHNDNKIVLIYLVERIVRSINYAKKLAVHNSRGKKKQKKLKLTIYYHLFVCLRFGSHASIVQRALL